MSSFSGEDQYADDGIACFEKEEDSRKFLKVLPLRLAKFGLELNTAKTKLIEFGKSEAYQRNTFSLLINNNRGC